METDVNFFKLRQELENLGFTSPEVVNDLRAALTEDRGWTTIHTFMSTEKEELHFALHFAREYDGRRSLDCYDAVINPEPGSNWQKMSLLRDQCFRPEVPVKEAISLLQNCLVRDEVNDRIAVTPMSRQEVRASLGLYPINPVNQNIMDTENLEYLKKNLLNLGFGDKLNGEMEKLIAAKVPEFSLTMEQEYNKKKMDYTLHFKASDQSDRYFFNRYEASLKNEADPTKDRTQTLYINKGYGITAKEAFNLLEGRSVEKKLYNAESQSYMAWVKLNMKERDDNGNYKIVKYSEGYGYDLEKTLAKYPIKELETESQKTALIRSLTKGNAQQVTIQRDNREVKYYIAAEPQYKTLNIYDGNMQSVKREQLQKPEMTQEQTKAKEHKQNQKHDPGDDTKSQSRKRKVTA